MNLDHELLNNSKMAEIIQNFYEMKHYKTALNQAIKDMGDLCNIDRVCFILEDELVGGCLTAFEYEIGLEPINYISDISLDFNSHINFGSDNIYKDKIKFLKIFEDKDLNKDLDKDLEYYKQPDFFTTLDFSSIKNIMSNMNFSSKCENNINEFAVFLVNDKNFFSYVTLERYHKPFTQQEKTIIKTLLRLISDRIKNFDIEKRFQDEYKMLNVIVNNEKMPIALVEKDTYTILYHNELYKQILPKITTNIKCFTLYGYTERCPNCYLDDSSNQVQRLESDNNYWIKKSTPIKLSNGTEAYMIYAKDTNDFLKQLEGIDILTNLFSLKGFSDYYNESIINSDYNYAVCTIDVDKFKNINNTFGYEVGNNVLLEISKVLVNFKSESERCCRINEDRFAIFLKYDDIEELKCKILLLREHLSEMQQIKFTDKKITIIGGLCLIDKEKDLNILLDKANIARKLAKGSHESQFVFYNEKLENEAERERFIEERMFSAVTHEEFIPYLQPKFDLRTMEIYGAEALVRWITPNGMIYPDEFIPLFEKNGFINILDFVVYRKIMMHLRSCLDRGLRVYPISLNVSRGHIQDKNFINKFMELVKNYNIPLDLLELEVTESVFIEDKNDLKNFIDQLKNNNLKVSIDDFGTAYSSLQTLTDLNIDVLKIDKGFIDNIGLFENIKSNEKYSTDNLGNNINKEYVFTKDEIVIKHVINLAKDLGFEVICEGIETFSQVEILKRLDCYYGQGYLFAKPMSLLEYEEKFLI